MSGSLEGKPPINPISHFKKAHLLTALIFCLFGCTISPSRKLIAGGAIEPEIAASALIGNPKEGFPAVPNVNVGVRYGVTDVLNVGASLNPMTLLVEGTVMAEPYAVLGVVRQKARRPSVNLHGSFPLLISPPNREVVCFPLLGLTPSWTTDRSIWYVTFEGSFDKKTYERGIDPHFTVRGGWESALQPRLSLVLEAGLANIGRESIITNADFGQPILAVGLCRTLLRGKEGLE
mgnify:CR=1 FL=1